MKNKIFEMDLFF